MVGSVPGVVAAGPVVPAGAVVVVGAVVDAGVVVVGSGDPQPITRMEHMSRITRATDNFFIFPPA